MADTIQSLWWPKLGEMEQLSIRSYLRNGHTFHLYSYGPCEGVPVGAVIKDASEILPFEDSRRFWNLAQFADWFRYNLLLKRGGWWVDLDTICLRHFDFEFDDVVLTQEDYRGRAFWATNAYMKAPAGHPILKHLVEQANLIDVGTQETSNPDSEYYIAIGPKLLTETAEDFGVELQPSRLFNYFNSSDNPCWLECLRVPAVPLPPDAYAVHLYRTSWRNAQMWRDGRPTLAGGNSIPNGCLYSQLRERYGPKVLVAVSSCWRDKLKGCNQAIRDTWGKSLPANYELRFFFGDQPDVRFAPEFVRSPDTMNGELPPHNARPAFIGNPATLLPDEILLRYTPDNYLGLSWKTVESLRWAIENGYEFIFRAFCDTYIIGERLAAAGLEEHEAVGWLWDCCSCPAHPGLMHRSPLGGTGYWVSARIAQIVADCPIDHWAEDAQVGWALYQEGINWHHDGRFPHDPDNNPEFWADRITLHLGDRHESWGPERMQKAHERVHAMLTDSCWNCGERATVRHPGGARCKRCGKRR